MTETLKIFCLSGFQAFYESKPIEQFTSNKTRALLAYLALSKWPQPRLSLAHLLWGELSEDNARNNLRISLHNLRQLFRDHLLVTRQTVAINPKMSCWVDALAFEQTCKQAMTGNREVEMYSQAIELYRGEFLKGFDTGNSDKFEEWLLNYRNTLHQQANQAFAHVAEHHAQHGQYKQGIYYTSKWLELEPWNEIAHRKMMLLLAHSGNRSAALAQFNTCKDRVRQELDVELAPATKSLYERLQRSPLSAPHNLPPQATPFVGRRQEVADVRAKLMNPQYRLLTLLGLGGIGKTRLGLAVAEHLLHHFLDGVFFVSLSDTDLQDVLIGETANAVGFSFEGVHKPEAQLLDYLADKELLLVLDGFELLAEKPVFLPRLLERCPHVKVLLTSRLPLNIKWEWRYPLSGLDVPENEDEDALGNFGATNLFLQCAKRIQPDHAALDEGPLIIRICKKLEGIPLAIEMVVANLRYWHPHDLQHILGGEAIDLSDPRYDVPVRQRSLKIVFDESWSLLHEGDRDLLQNLSAFHGGCSQEAAQAICAESQLAWQDLLSKLNELADRCWLKIEQPKQGTRIRLLDPIVGYLRAKFDNPADWAAVCNRHLSYFSAYVTKTMESQIQWEPDPRWLDPIQLEFNQLRAAIMWSINSHQPEKGLRLMIDMSSFWISTERCQEGLGLFAQLMGMSEKVDATTFAKAKAMRAWLAWRQCAFDDALRWAEESLSTFQGLDDKTFLIFSSIIKGACLLSMGDFEHAQGWLNTTLALCEEQHDAFGLAWMHHFLGVSELSQDNVSSAKAHFKTVTTKFDSADTRFCLKLTRAMLSMIALYEGKIKEATSLINDVATYYEAFDYKWGRALVSHLLGLVAQAQGDLASASELQKNSLRLQRTIGFGDKSYLPSCLEALASIVLALNQPEDAVLLMSAADGIRSTYQIPIPKQTRALTEDMLTALQDSLDAQTYRLLWESERVVSLEAAVEFALDELDEQEIRYIGER